MQTEATLCFLPLHQLVVDMVAQGVVLLVLVALVVAVEIITAQKELEHPVKEMMVGMVLHKEIVVVVAVVLLPQAHLEQMVETGVLEPHPQ
jgi:hypothetical protein